MMRREVTAGFPLRRGRLQAVSIRGHAVNQSYAGNASGRSDTRNDNRTRLYIGPAMVSGMRLAFSGMVVNSGAAESALGNEYGIEAALESSTPAGYQILTFNGQPSGTVPDGGLLISDAAGFVLPRDTLLYARTSVTLASAALKFPRLALAWTAGSGDFTSSNAAAASQVAATGAMTNPAGGSTALRGLPPYMVLGVPAAPCPAVAIFGDSIADGQGEQSGPSSLGSLGYIQRGLEAVNGMKIPYTAFSTASNRFQYDTPANGAGKRQVLKYFTHAIIALGGSDISGGASLAALQGYLTDMCEEFRRITGPYGKPLHLSVCKVLPRSSSSDAWASIAGQTVTANFGAGSVRDQYNAWLDTQAGRLFDAVIDANVYAEDAANYGKWVVNGTANYATNDGVQLRQAMHILASQAVSGWAAGLAV